MADRISISYKDYNNELIQYIVHTTKELKKKLIQIRRFGFAGFNYKIAVMPYYNSMMTKKDWREFSRIRDIVGAERIALANFRGANTFEFVNPQRDEIWVPNFYKN